MAKASKQFDEDQNEEKEDNELEEITTLEDETVDPADFGAKAKKLKKLITDFEEAASNVSGLIREGKTETIEEKRDLKSANEELEAKADAVHNEWDLIDKTETDDRETLEEIENLVEKVEAKEEEIEKQIEKIGV